LNAYVEALEICPENPELLTTVRPRWWRCSQLMSMNSDWWSTSWKVGLLYLKLGNNTKAFEFFGNSLSYDPKNSKTILAAGKNHLTVLNACGCYVGLGITGLLVS
jgi:hypothetical protein